MFDDLEDANNLMVEQRHNKQNSSASQLLPDIHDVEKYNKKVTEKMLDIEDSAFNSSIKEEELDAFLDKEFDQNELEDKLCDE